MAKGMGNLLVLVLGQIHPTPVDAVACPLCGKPMDFDRMIGMWWCYDDSPNGDRKCTGLTSLREIFYRNADQDTRDNGSPLDQFQWQTFAAYLVNGVPAGYATTTRGGGGKTNLRVSALPEHTADEMHLDGYWVFVEWSERENVERRL